MSTPIPAQPAAPAPVYRIATGMGLSQNYQYVENLQEAMKVAANNPAYRTQMYQKGLIVYPGIFQCCGLVGLSGISNTPFTTWLEKATFLKLLVDTYGSDPGHLIYVLEKHQLETPLHKLFVEIGAKQMGETFRNLRYDDHHLSIWLVNIRDRSKMAAYLDNYGRVKPDPTAKPVASATAAAKVAVKAAVEANVVANGANPAGVRII